MCEKCVAAVKKWFPKVAKKDYGDLLMSATCFPLCGAKMVKKQLRQMAKKGITTLEEASAYACDELFKSGPKVKP